MISPAGWKKTASTSAFLTPRRRLAGVGIGTVPFPISIAVKTEDANLQAKVSKDLETILYQLCETSHNSFSAVKKCATGKKAVAKVNTGSNGKQTTYEEVLLDRTKLAANQVDPAQVHARLAAALGGTAENKVGTLRNADANGNDYDIVLASSGPRVTDAKALAVISVPTLDGRQIPLSDVATIRTVNAPNNIMRVDGATVSLVTAKLNGDPNDQQKVALIQQKAIDTFNKDYKPHYGKASLTVDNFVDGQVASINKSFKELGIALGLSILLTYIVLVVFFNSLLMPLVILFAIPLTFLGVFPAIALFGDGQFGLLEIIGMIILVGLVENVAIFLIDLANKKVAAGMDEKRAIILASGIRFRPIVLTKLIALVSLLPLILLSLDFRTLSLVIVAGLLTSGILSLFITPILYIAFRHVHRRARTAPQEVKQFTTRQLDKRHLVKKGFLTICSKLNVFTDSFDYSKDSLAGHGGVFSGIN